MHINFSYEETYIRSLQQCTIQDALEGFDRERKAFLSRKNYEDHIKATIYWARLQLLLSHYEKVRREIASILGKPWFEGLDVFTRARFRLINAKLHYSLGAFEKAYEETGKALKLALSVLSESQIPERDRDYFFCRAYLVKAKIDWRRRDIYRARLFMALSWAYYDKCPRIEGHYLPARLLCHYGQIYLQEGMVSEAREYFLKSKAFYQKSGYLGHFYLPETLALLGECSIREREFGEAEAAVSKGLRLLEAHFKEAMNRNRAHLLHLMARIQVGQSEQSRSPDATAAALRKAMESLKAELQIRKELFGGQGESTTTRIYNLFSKVHRLRGEYEEAVAKAQTALKKNVRAYSHMMMANSPASLADSAGSSHHFLKSLLRKAEAYRGKYKSGSGRGNSLEKAWDCIRAAQAVINTIREKYYAHESKVNVGAYARVIFELGMEILLERQKKAAGRREALGLIHEEIFELFRNSKSFLLLQALHPYSISSISGRRDKTGEYSPESLRRLMAGIEGCFSSGFELQGPDEELIKEVIHASEEDIRADIKKEIRDNHDPVSTKKLRLEDIYMALSRETETGDIISYFLGQNALYAMVIQGSKGMQFEKLLDGAEEINRLQKDARELAALFNQFNTGEICNDFSRFTWKKPDPTQDPNWRLVDYSQRLYRILFAKLESRARRLYIIPDEHLFHIPFGFLSKPLPENKTPTAFSGLPFLALDYKISYHISTSLLYENHERSYEGPQPPSPTDEEKGTYLLYNIAGRLLRNGVLTGDYNAQNLMAIRNVAGLLGVGGNDPKDMPGEILKKELKKCAEHLLFLHFFGHSHEGEESSLLIEEEKSNGKKVLMTQAEIQHLKLHSSQLILINACRGGAGKTENGEAPVSIFQAFLKAGARNIYYSLFQIDQRAARRFTCRFVSRLRAGNNFIDALSETQREFINKGNRDSHPTVWASPSFIGNQMQALYFPKQDPEK